jgi:hypothetical protein
MVFTDVVSDDPADLDDERLETQICGMAGLLAAQERLWLELIGEFDRRERYAAWECTSTAYWLNWHCGLSKGAARERVRVARALEHLDLVAAEFAAGRLSYSKVRAITRVATAATEVMLVELGLAGTAAQLERVCAGYRRVNHYEDDRQRRDLHDALDDGAREEAEAAARAALAGLSLWHDDDGLTQLRARVVPHDGALIEAALAMALEDLTDAQTDRDGVDLESAADTGSVSAETSDDSGRPTRADALVELARHYLTHQPPTPTIERRHLLVHVDVGHLTATGQLGIDGDGRCTLNGQRITPATAQHLGLHAGAPLTTVLIDHRGLPLSVGRTSRHPTTAQRLALHLRDHGHCRYPGCPNQRTDAHHLIDWDHLGPTDLDNLLQLCSRHHHLVHRAGLTISYDRDTNHATYHRPDGTQIATRTPNPDDTPPPPRHVDTPRPGEAGTRLELADIVENLAWHDDHARAADRRCCGRHESSTD